MKYLVLFLVMVSVASPLLAETYLVERDGSGDFTIIQDAVDAAASGDTIRIGPGRYDEKQLVTTYGWSEFIRVLPTQNVLTLIGSGTESTIIGPAEPWDESADRGISFGPYFGSNYLTIEGIHFENMKRPIVGDSGLGLTVNACSFSGCREGVALVSGGNLSVDTCLFEDLQGDGTAIISLGNSETLITNCIFNFPPPDITIATSIRMQGNPVSLVQGCEFIGGRYGIQYSFNGSATMNNCVFSGQRVKGVSGNGNTDLRISGSEFHEQCVAIGDGSSWITIDASAIYDVSELSFGFSDYTHLTVNNCILAHGPEYTIRQYRHCDKADKDLITLDFTNNDWGTSDATTIESWIHVCDYAVEYVPYIGMPVATERTSWDSLKAMFK